MGETCGTMAGIPEPSSSSPRRSPFLYASHPIWIEHSHETPRAITAQKSEERTRERARAEREEITLYCILVNWRGGEKIGATSAGKGERARTPARPPDQLSSLNPFKGAKSCMTHLCAYVVEKVLQTVRGIIIALKRVQFNVIEGKIMHMSDHSPFWPRTT